MRRAEGEFLIRALPYPHRHEIWAASILIIPRLSKADTEDPNWSCSVSDLLGAWDSFVLESHDMTFMVVSHNACY